jgi:hypothetical protein
MSGPFYGWHFLRENRRLGYGDNRLYAAYAKQKRA